MTRTTVAAHERIERYLEEVRARLRPHPGVDEEEVVRDVREHIDAALATEPAPVADPVAASVLERLGPPDTWLPDDELPPVRAAFARLRHGPEDWRLAYVSAATLLLGVTLPVLGLPLVIGLMFILAAYVSGRASIELVRERPAAGRGQRWLAYPAVLGVQTALLVALLLWPLGLVLPVGATGGWIDALRDAGRSLPAGGTAEAWRLTGRAMGLVQGLWWIAVGRAASRRPDWLRRLLYPLGGEIGPRAGRALSVAGFLIAVASAVLWWLA